VNTFSHNRGRTVGSGRFERVLPAAVFIPVKSIIRNLSAPTEFFLIIFVCFGLTLAVGAAWTINHLWKVAPSHPNGVAHADSEDVIHLKNISKMMALLLAWSSH